MPGNTDPNTTALEKFKALVKADATLPEDIRAAIEKDCAASPITFAEFLKTLEASHD